MSVLITLSYALITVFLAIGIVVELSKRKAGRSYSKVLLSTNTLGACFGVWVLVERVSTIIPT